MPKSTRKNIPDHIALKLWVHAGGRCEFPSCNELVWRDKLTFKEDNFSHIAHIVAASPDGPRGKKDTSANLQVDFDNLMLVCLTHSKLIDGRNSSEYSTEQLREYKQKHEERIMRQTAIGPENATVPVRFQANIGERRVEVSKALTYQALYPLFPADDKGVFLDFSSKAGTGDQDFWTEFAREITEKVKQDFRKGNGEQRYEHLSIFALGPIPLLVNLGNQIGNTVPAVLYQKHRDTEDWKWKEEPKNDPFQYRVTKNDGIGSDIALVLSLSGKITEPEYRKIVGNAPVYEIEIDKPETSFLSYRSRLDKFRMVYRQLLNEIRAKHGADCKIHLFPAIPAPIAVLCGRELLPKSDPQMLVYDNDKSKGGFNHIITIK